MGLAVCQEESFHCYPLSDNNIFPLTRDLCNIRFLDPLSVSCVGSIPWSGFLIYVFKKGLITSTISVP